ncbi:hypothetical protein GH714_037590 [Hevea brasiliensis]|uniref:NB-ARC domain-containing protein n=1 Tax=Hevea brasiliensis TaxID=3981 RepID=A0A6A6L9R4_HEVBR|nr:hypothetical protein GH714_037590 [Hevea brasiliensis]
MLAWNLKDDLKGLRESLTMIRAVLLDAEEQQTKREPVRLWLKKLREVAYEAEDVLDELAYENLRRKVEMQEQSGSEIKNEAMGYGLQVVTKDRIMPQIDLDRVTDSVLDDPVVGREADVSKIVNLLNCSNDQQVLTIVSIVGMGGLGKTTLAKLVCQEVMEKKFFDLKIWVCVSDNFDDQRILGEMLQTLNANMGGLTNKDAVLQELEKALEGKKFLLVLDDVWNEERAFGNGEASIPLDLECIGKEIAKKCRGVPLAAKVLDNKDNVESVLKLSFDHLPPFLKPCFAYCSIFPKDFDIAKKELVQLWMAEGFLGSSSQDEGNKSSKCNNFDSILKRDAKKLRSLFIKEIAFDGSWKLKRLRTLNLEDANIEELPSSIGKLKHLRYLNVSGTKIEVLPESITKLYNLQTLKFSWCNSLKEVPRNKMCNLISLRHIEFSKDDHMPSMVGRLTRLETLIICCGSR